METKKTIDAFESICEQLNIEVLKLDFDKSYNRVDEFLGL